VKQGWQKTIFRGRRPDGSEFEEHQTRLAIREFAPPEPVKPILQDEGEDRTDVRTNSQTLEGEAALRAFALTYPARPKSFPGANASSRSRGRCSSFSASPWAAASLQREVAGLGGVGARDAVHGAHRLRSRKARLGDRAVPTSDEVPLDLLASGSTRVSAPSPEIRARAT